jgi:phage-related protein
MRGQWNILYYQSRDDKISPLYVFIESLEVKAQAKIANTFNLLEEYGIKLGLPHVKKITGTELWELRILGVDNIRIFYIAVTGKTFLLLHGFIKKKQKTDQKELKIALNRLIEYRTSGIRL